MNNITPKMKTHRWLFTGALMLVAPLVSADSFGTGGSAFTIDFSNVGNAGNAADDTGFGDVGYDYRIGTYAVSESMIDSFNALNTDGLTITKDARGADRPATNISWNEAARFVNWLNTSSGYSAAYKFNTTGMGTENDNIALWNPGDAGFDAENRFRNSNAHYFLPSENELYKAAYYDPNHSGPGVGGYWDYATGSDAAPTAVAGGTAANTAVYDQGFGAAAGPADVTNAGGQSAYGTVGQSGNVFEWAESSDDASNDLVSESRSTRGGDWRIGESFLRSDFRNLNTPVAEITNLGFRVASSVAVPEPSSVSLLGLGLLGLLMRRKRS